MYIRIAAIVSIIVSVMIIRNNFIKLKLAVDNSFSAMDVFLKKRYDLLPDLVAAVRSYVKHENDTFIKTTEARTKAMASQNSSEIVKENHNIDEYITQIFVIAEDYPELKASENYSNLTNQMRELEEQISNARLYYNGCVTKYNIAISKFPASLFASLFGFKQVNLFEIDEQSRNNVDLEM